jgi:hypothetical protein
VRLKTSGAFWKAILAPTWGSDVRQGSPSRSKSSSGFRIPRQLFANGRNCPHKSSEAAVEFQKILDHRGVVVNEAIGAVAHLGLARAYVLQSDPAKARRPVLPTKISPPVERRRPTRHPHPKAGERGVREVAIDSCVPYASAAPTIGLSCYFLRLRSKLRPSLLGSFSNLRSRSGGHDALPYAC